MRRDPLKLLEELAELVEAATVHIACHPDAADPIKREAIRRGVPVEVHPTPYVPAGTAYAFDPTLLEPWRAS